MLGSRGATLRQGWSGRLQVPSEKHRGLWWDHDVTRHAEPSPMQLHEVETRNNRYHAGAAELSDKSDPPAIDENLSVLWRYLNLQAATGWRVWRRRIGISRSSRPVCLLALDRVTCQCAGNRPHRCADGRTPPRRTSNSAKNGTCGGTDRGTGHRPALPRARRRGTPCKHQQEDHTYCYRVFHCPSPLE